MCLGACVCVCVLELGHTHALTCVACVRVRVWQTVSASALEMPMPTTACNFRLPSNMIAAHVCEAYLMAAAAARSQVACVHISKHCLCSDEEASAGDQCGHCSICLDLCCVCSSLL